MAATVETGRCTSGNECKLTVQNATKIEGMESDITYIRDKVDKIVLGVAGSVILLLASFVWQLATNFK